MKDNIVGICAKCGKPIHHEGLSVKSLRNGKYADGRCTHGPKRLIEAGLSK